MMRTLQAAQEKGHHMSIKCEPIRLLWQHCFGKDPMVPWEEWWECFPRELEEVRVTDNKMAEINGQAVPLSVSCFREAALMSEQCVGERATSPPF